MNKIPKRKLSKEEIKTIKENINKCSSRHEFQQKFRKDYTKLKLRKLLEKYFKKIPKKRNVARFMKGNEKNALNKELIKIKEIIKKCKTRKEFCTKYPYEYNLLSRKKILRKYTKVIPRQQSSKKGIRNKKRTCFTQQELNEIIKLARKCKTRTEIRNSKEFRQVEKIRKDLIPELMSHLPKSSRAITREQIKKEAIKHKKVKDFIDKGERFYRAASRQGILKDVCGHMTKEKKDRSSSVFLKWLKAACEECKTMQKFSTLYPKEASYVRSNKDKYLKYTSILTRAHQNHYSSLGENSLREYLQKLLGISLPKSRPDWLINPHSGKKLELDGYSRKHKIAFEHNGAFHLIGKNPQRDIVKVELCKKKKIKLIVITDLCSRHYETVEDAEKHILAILKRKNIQIKNPHVKFRWIFKRHTRSKWTYRKLKNISLKYDSLKKFRNTEVGAWCAIQRLGFKKELTSHMKQDSRPYRKTHSDKSLYNKALSCADLSKFKQKFPNHYKALYRRPELYKKVLKKRQLTWKR